MTDARREPNPHVRAVPKAEPAKSCPVQVPSRQPELEEKAKRLAVLMRELGVRLNTCGCCGGADLMLVGEEKQPWAYVEGFDTKQSLGDI